MGPHKLRAKIMKRANQRDIEAKRRRTDTGCGNGCDEHRSVFHHKVWNCLSCARQFYSAFTEFPPPPHVYCVSCITEWKESYKGISRFGNWRAIEETEIICLALMELAKSQPN